MTDFGKVTRKLHAAYPELSAQLRKAARFALKEPAFIALYPLRKVATRAGVSPASLVRLATQLDFESYRGFRDAFRAGMHAGMGSARYAVDAESLVGRKGGRAFEKVYDDASQLLLGNIRKTFNTISADAVEAAGNCLARARRIYILGLRANFGAAFYFDYVLKTFTRKSVLLEGRLGMLIDEMGDIGPRDAMLALSGEPYALDAVKAVDYATKARAQVVSITDSSLSPIAHDAAHVFVVPTTGPSFYQSHIAKLALLECFVCVMVTRGGPQVVERVKEEFQRRERFGVYWREKPRA